MTDHARPLREVLGDGARRVREGAELRQEDIARQARIHGLAWDRSRIAALERGEKAVSAEDLAVLPLVYSRACRRPVALAELMQVPDDARIRLTSRVEMSGRALARAYSGGDLDSLPIRELHAPSELRPDVAAALARSDAVTDRIIELGLLGADPTASEVEGAIRRGAEALGEAERKAGQRLGEDAVVVASLAFAVWGRSLTSERDRLLGSRADTDDAGRRRALRGRITRQLVDQLRDEITRRTGGSDGQHQEEA